MASDDDVEALADSIVGCFSNAIDLPEWMQVLASDWLAAHDAEVAARARAEALREAPSTGRAGPGSSPRVESGLRGTREGA